MTPDVPLALDRETAAELRRACLMLARALDKALAQHVVVRVVALVPDVDKPPGDGVD